LADPIPTHRVLEFPKTVELEQRLARNEVTISELQATIATSEATMKDLRDTVQMLHKRIMSLQAQLDHVFAKIKPY
jgi:uncharacterized coiled-coil protein SlyX